MGRSAWGKLSRHAFNLWFTGKTGSRRGGEMVKPEGSSGCNGEKESNFIDKGVKRACTSVCQKGLM